MLKDAWTLAIETLSWISMQRLSERLALARTMKQLNITQPNAVRLAYGLVCETIRRRNFIDKFINTALKPNTLEEYDLGIQAFLRMYVYHTRFQSNWTTINSHEAARVAGLARSILGWETLRKVEPVLGLLLTQVPDVVFDGVSDEERIALQTYHPTWYVKYCIRLFGRTKALAILEADNQPLPTYIRLNTLKAGEHEIIAQLAQEGLTIEKVEQLKYAYRVVSTKHPILDLPSFKEGYVFIQDKASCFAAEAVDPKPGNTILDVCAAPGAKTTYFAQCMENSGSIFSLDYSKRRMSVWQRETIRMGVSNAEPIIADARLQLPLLGQTDAVVLDPPCTGTGTFGKTPSAKWRLSPSSIDRMSRFQWLMLDNCASYVKQSGTLTYSTCSITVEENEMQIERFLKWHPEFVLVEITPKIGAKGLRGLEKCRRLYPHIDQCNGFFIAKLKREI